MISKITVLHFNFKSNYILNIKINTILAISTFKHKKKKPNWLTFTEDKELADK